MNLVTSFAIHVKKNCIDINYLNADQHLKEYKEKLIAETEYMDMCGYALALGDYVEVRIKGGKLLGKIKCFYPHIPQVQLESGWCFHPNDEIIVHKPQATGESLTTKTN